MLRTRSSHASKPKGLTPGECIYFEEDVYINSTTGKPYLAGKRTNTVQVIGKGIPGQCLVLVLESKGFNAFPVGCKINKPSANLLSGDDVNVDVSEYFKAGGTIKHNQGSAGGYLVGKKHSEGGIPGVNKSTGQHIEVEGGEVIITAPAVDDNSKREFEGEMLTNREILSKINQSGGGVSFADGGTITSCKCSGKSYRFGGALLSDFDIIKRMNG